MNELIVKPRTTTGKMVRGLRQQGKIPAVIYGHGIKNQPVEVEYLNFDKVYRAAGGSSLVDLKVGEGQSVKVIIQAVQRNAVSGDFEHVDFHQVRMDEKITAEVPIVFVGEAKAVKELGGVLVKNLNQIKIECLPQDLQHEVAVDISALDSFDKSIQIKDLVLPKSWHVLGAADEVIVAVEPPRSEAELEALKGEVVEDVEKVEGVKKEEPVAGDDKADKKEESK